MALGKLVEHFDVLFLIEELVLVEIMWLDYHAPTIAVGIVIDKIGIVLDFAVKFKDLPWDWGVKQNRLHIPVVVGAECKQQIFYS